MVTILLSLSPSRREFFLDSHCENLVVFLKGKVMKIRGSPNTGPWGVSHYQASQHPDSSNLPKSPQKCSYQFMGAVASALGKRTLAVIRCIHVPSRFQGGGLTCGPSSLMRLKFRLSFCSDFYLLFGCGWQLPNSLRVGIEWFAFQIPAVKFYFYWHSLFF